MVGVFQIVYITEEICCIGFLTILLVSIVLRKHKTRMLKELLLLYSAMALWFISEIFVYLLEGRPQYVTLLQVFDSISYTFSVGAFLFFFAYLLELVRYKKGIEASIKINYFFIIVLAVGLVYYLSHRFRWFMHYDENGFFVAGRYFSMVLIPIHLTLLFGILLLIIYRKLFSSMQFLSLVLFLCLPELLVLLGSVIPFSMIPFALTLGGTFQYVYLIFELDDDVIRLDRELSEQKTQVILSQIQPHFLYNSLAAISTLCILENAETSRLAIEKFASYLRGNLEVLKGSAMVSFEKELDHVQTYLWLEKLRFEDDLEVIYDIQTRNFQVPSLIIQPLVENAVKHGICQKEHGGMVRISTFQEGNDICIKVEDTGAGFDVSAKLDDGRSPVGLENTKARIENLCHGTMHIESTIGIGTKVTICLPAGRQG